MKQPSNTNKILVIKLSALGDFVQALGAMRAIRDHHKDDHITLLTTKGLKALAEKSGYFDDILIDERAKLFQIHKLLSLRKKLNKSNFSRVYDLQNNDRSCLYFKLFSPKPEWVGIAKGASHRNTSQERNAGLAFDGHKQTLSLAGVNTIEVDNLSWIKGDIARFNLPNAYALIIPGSAPQHPQKRWNSDNFIWLSHRLINSNIIPVLIGTNVEKDIADKISKNCPACINLVGQTDLYDLPDLAKGSVCAIGNDTGPMHFIGPTDTQTFVLFTPHSNPGKHRPLGSNVHPIRTQSVSREDVWKTISAALNLHA